MIELRASSLHFSRPSLVPKPEGTSDTTDWEAEMKFRDHRLDFTMELARFGDDFWRLSRFARIFVQEAPQRVEAISRGVHARDGILVHEGAARLSELLDSLGAPDALGITEEVARYVHDEDFARAKTLVIALRRDVDLLVAAVKEWPPLAAAA
jgi:hypothetical protein